MKNARENIRQELNQMSRRGFLKDALLAVGLAFFGPMALLDACNGTKKAPVETLIIPAQTETATEPAITADQAVAAMVSPMPSSLTADSSTINYSLTIDGLVNSCLTLNYESISQFPSVTKSVTLTCPGVFEETSEWTGVPVITMLTAAGIKPEATQVIIDSGDYAAPFSVQEQAITSGDIFLAFKVNGQGLPADRGFPVRLVVPNMEGTLWVKRVTHIKLV